MSLPPHLFRIIKELGVSFQLIQFSIISSNSGVPSMGQNAAFLIIDNWNDFSFITMFYVTLFDENGVQHNLGSVKIGFKGQDTSASTHSVLGQSFLNLPSGYFSVGQDVEYYSKLYDEISSEFRTAYLEALCDVAHDQNILSSAIDERVFGISHLRNLNLNTITGQFRRILNGEMELTDYKFRFTQDGGEKRAGYQLEFDVTASSKPTTNIHAIIGRNGVGKTTLLNNMTKAITEPDCADNRFESVKWLQHEPIGRDYFSSLISISFSAFDPFNPPEEQADPSKGTCYFYVGLKVCADDSGSLLKSQNDLAEELIESLNLCLSEQSRAQRWMDSIQNLESDDNFAQMNLVQLTTLQGQERDERTRFLLRKMSSGHAIVLLTITKLVARVDEKTLVLFDEPESHLHPPLLSALIRCLSRLLSSRNAIAIIATHSPVVLQEIPKSCVWKITRHGLASSSQRPEIETFGENVGLLTREVFGLEVAKSGFNALLEEEAGKASSYEKALAAFDNQLGFEGRAILRSIMHKSEQE